MQIGILFILIGPGSDQNNREFPEFLLTNLTVIFKLIGV